MSVPMPQREYTNICQFITHAGDQATAQAQLQAALNLVKPMLDAQVPPVQLLPEVERGIWVLSQR